MVVKKVVAKKVAGSKKAAAEPKVKCQTCNHVSSFHKGQRGPCFVVGCTCSKWTGPLPKKASPKKG